MKLYEIDLELMNLVDPETGEILDFDSFAELQMERESKIENMALWYKNLAAEADAIKAERDALYEREKAAKNHAEGLKKYLSQILNGEKFTTPRVAVTFRKSTAVVVDDGFLEWAKENADQFLRYKDPEVDKAAIKDAIKAGQMLDMARLVDNQSMQIK